MARQRLFSMLEHLYSDWLVPVHLNGTKNVVKIALLILENLFFPTSFSNSLIY